MILVTHFACCHQYKGYWRSCPLGWSYFTVMPGLNLRAGGAHAPEFTGVKPMYVSTSEIVQKANSIVAQCGTRDPLRIAKDLGIEVMYYPFNEQRGAYVFANIIEILLIIFGNLKYCVRVIFPKAFGILRCTWKFKRCITIDMNN